MKKILSAALAGTLLVTAAAAPAMAAPRSHHAYRNDGYRHNNTGAAIGLGLGLFALGAIIASSQNRNEVYYGPRYEPRYVPPPPPPRYGYGRYGYDGYYYGR